MLQKLVNAIQRVFKKPPALEGDFNFLELEHPEFGFTRIPPEDEHGLPCEKTFSPLGEIYVCAFPKFSRKLKELDIESRVFVCSEFEYNGVKGKYCSEPCLIPAEGEEYRGLVVTPRGEKEGIIELTPFAASAYSQMVAIKSFLTGENTDEYDVSVGMNLLRAFESNLYSFAWDEGLCSEERVKEGNSFLELMWSRLRDALGERKLKETGRHIPYKCYNRDAYSGFVRMGGVSWSHVAELIGKAWGPERDSIEFAERYLYRFRKGAELRQELQQCLKVISVKDILKREEDYDIEEEISDEIYSIRADLITEIYDSLSEKSCWELVDEGITDKEICREIDRLEELIDKMRKHTPIPGQEEEYMNKLEEYKDELESIQEGLLETISEYAYRLGNEKIQYEYIPAEYGELQAEDSWVAREFMDIIKEYCEERSNICLQICSEKGVR